MKDIRFRAWDEKEKKYYTVINLPCDPFNGIYSDIGKIVERPANLENDSIDVHFEGLIIMQYTGLKDCNGKEIYENDIIQGDLFNRDLPTMGQIIFDSNLQAYVNKNDAGNTLLFKINNIKVIGNIYENPEIIKIKFLTYFKP